MKTTMKPKGKALAKSLEKRNKKLVPEVKESDMTDIDWKIHNLLLAEGYAVTNTLKLTGDVVKIKQIEYLKGEKEVVCFITHRMGPSKETK